MKLMSTLESGETEKEKQSAEIECSDLSEDIAVPCNRYGNMWVFFHSQRHLITLGPDCSLLCYSDMCFFVAICVFIILETLTIYRIFLDTQNIVVRLLSVCSALVQVIVYIALAISNPGIVTVDSLVEQSEEAKDYRLCRKCHLRILPDCRHCSQCDVCIEGYDHHCPWSSKCIGRHNLTRFYIFAIYTPINIGFCIVVLALLSRV